MPNCVCVWGGDSTPSPGNAREVWGVPLTAPPCSAFPNRRRKASWRWRDGSVHSLAVLPFPRAPVPSERYEGSRREPGQMGLGHGLKGLSWSNRRVKLEVGHGQGSPRPISVQLSTNLRGPIAGPVLTSETALPLQGGSPEMLPSPPFALFSVDPTFPPPFLLVNGGVLHIPDLDLRRIWAVAPQFLPLSSLASTPPKLSPGLGLLGQDGKEVQQPSWPQSKGASPLGTDPPARKCDPLGSAKRLLSLPCLAPLGHDPLWAPMAFFPQGSPPPLGKRGSPPCKLTSTLLDLRRKHEASLHHKGGWYLPPYPSARALVPHGGWMLGEVLLVLSLLLLGLFAGHQVGQEQWQRLANLKQKTTVESQLLQGGAFFSPLVPHSVLHHHPFLGQGQLADDPEPAYDTLSLESSDSLETNLSVSGNSACSPDNASRSAPFTTGVRLELLTFQALSLGL